MKMEKLTMDAIYIFIRTCPIFMVMYSKTILSMEDFNDIYQEQNNYLTLNNYPWVFKLHSKQQKCTFEKTRINTLGKFFSRVPGLSYMQCSFLNS